MKRLNIRLVRPGMKLARTVYNSNGQVLIQAGVTLNKRYIEKLIHYGVSIIWVEMENAAESVVITDVVNRKTRLAAVRQVENILINTKESGRLVIEPQSLYNTISAFTDQLLSAQNLLYSLSDLKTQDNYTFVHSVNVCILAMMTGITLGYHRQELCELGVGALLHDLGKVKIPDAILNKPGPLTTDEFEVMKKHSVYGYELIREAGILGEIPAIVALQHHETYDGTGYPLGIGGEKFHEFAQITAIADKFDAITGDRVYRKGYPPHEAYEMCAAASNYYYKDRIVRAFMHNIAAYPAGTLVELSNGMVAISVETEKGHSLFPRVRLVYDQYMHPIEPMEIPLLEEPGLNIVRVLKSDATQNKTAY